MKSSHLNDCILGVKIAPKLALVDLVDDMLAEIGERLDPGSLLSLSRVSTAFFRLLSAPPTDYQGKQIL